MNKWLYYICKGGISMTCRNHIDIGLLGQANVQMSNSKKNDTITLVISLDMYV